MSYTTKQGIESAYYTRAQRTPLVGGAKMQARPTVNTLGTQTTTRSMIQITLPERAAKKNTLQCGSWMRAVIHGRKIQARIQTRLKCPKVRLSISCRTRVTCIRRRAKSFMRFARAFEEGLRPLMIMRWMSCPDPDQDTFGIAIEDCVCSAIVGCLGEVDANFGRLLIATYFTWESGLPCF